MRILLLILLNCFFFFCKAQHTHFLLNDTLFLRRDLREDVYSVTFITNSKKSPYYKSIASFNFDPYETDYSRTLNYLKDTTKQGTSTFKYSLPKEWVPLYKFQSKYYLYSGTISPIIKFTDSTIIEYQIDGPNPNIISQVNKVDEKTYQFSVYGISELQLTNFQKEFIVHLLGKDNKMAVLEKRLQDGEKPFYGLLLNAKYIKQFPIIVDYCNNLKLLDFDEFEPINYKELIKNN